MNALSLKKNSLFLITSNVISILISGISILVFPKILSVEDFGYWQIYILITMYLSYASFGISDGIYIRYSNLNDYEDNKRYIGFHYWLMLFVDSFIGISLILLLHYLNSNKETMLFYAVFSCLLVVPKSIILYFRQSMGDNVFTSKLLIIEKIIFLSGITLIYYFELDFSIQSLIYADLFSKVVSMISTIIIFPDYFKIKIEKPISFFIKEFFSNFRIGVIILFVNFSTMIILGILRLGIESNWSIEIFATISLILNFSNFLIIFINSLSLLTFPILTRNKKNLMKLKKYYLDFNRVLFILLLTTLYLSVFVSIIINLYLTEYSFGTKYSIIFFAIIIFEGKNIILSMNYLKVLRKEKILLCINVILIILTCIFYVIFIKILSNLFLTVLSMLILIVIKSLITEVYLLKLLSLKEHLNLLTQIFIVFSIVFIEYYYENYLITTTLISTFLVLYTILNRKVFLKIVKKYMNRGELDKKN